MRLMGGEARLRLIEQHAAASEALQSKGQYPALLARIEQLEMAVEWLTAVIGERLPKRPS